MSNQASMPDQVRQAWELALFAPLIPGIYIGWLWWGLAAPYFRVEETSK